MFERHRRLIVSGLVALTACGERAADAPAPSAPVAPPVIEIVGSDYAYTGPDTLPAGLVTIQLRNDGPELHHVTLFRLDQGKTAADLLTALQAEQFPPWAVMIGGPNAPVPSGRSETTLDLAPGSYAIVCLIPSPDGVPHFAKGMLKSVTVVGNPAATAVVGQEADVVMRLVDYDFVLSKPLTSGKHLIRVEVDSQQPHEVLLVRLSPGKTVAEVAAWAEKPEGPPPGEPIGGTTAIGPGGYNLLPVDLTPGEYGLICFLPDAGDGRLHLAHGMIKQFSIQ